MRPSDFLITFGLSSGSPRRRPTSFAGSLFFAGLRVHQPTRSRWRLITGSPCHRNVVEE